MHPIFEKHIPRHELAPYIEYYYILEIPMNGISSLYSPASIRNLMVLRYEDEMSFEINGGNISKCGFTSITGLANKPYSVFTNAKISKLFLIQFSPFGLSALFKQPANSFINNNHHLDALIRTEQKRDLCHLLGSSKSSLEKIGHIESFLSQFIPSEIQKYKIRTLIESVSHINESHNIRVNELADRLKSSERHLRRLFKEHIGIGPKEYLRINRFNKTFKQVLEHRSLDLYDYYDEPHFINEFQRFSGFTPKTYPKDLVSTEHLLESIPITVKI